MKDRIQKKIREYAIRNQKLYILPTKTGYFFFLILFVIFLMGISYGNNISLLISFLMFSFFFSSIIVSHNELKKKKIEDISFIPIFAGEKYKINCELKNKNFPNSFEIKSEDFKLSFNLKLESNERSEKREIKELKYLEISSKEPFGLFKTWYYLQKKENIFIYPKRLQSQNAHRTKIDKTKNSRTYELSEFHDLKKSDTPNKISKIYWKKFIENDEIYIKDFEVPVASHLNINFDELKGDLEEKLSIVTTLIYDQNKINDKWQLNISSKIFKGDYDQVLKYLAGFEETFE